MSTCPTCGNSCPPDPETGYDGDDFCSEECEEKDFFREIYEQGRRDGEERYAERLERALLHVKMLQERYDYLLKLKVEELNLQPPQPIFLARPSDGGE